MSNQRVLLSSAPLNLTVSDRAVPQIGDDEATGVVVQVGATVMDVKAGDRCAIVPLVPCKSCHYCVSNQFSLCDDY
jgi:L-iditol 2-dehydrogenase